MTDNIIPISATQTFAVRQHSADQALVIRCNYFPNEETLRAFLEGIQCPYGAYLELKQTYRAHLKELNALSREAQILFLSKAGFESAIVDSGGAG